TGMLLAPCCPLFGFTCVITGVPELTVKPLLSATTSAPLVTVTLVAPRVAAAAIDTGTVMLVPVAAVGAPAVMPAPLNVTIDAAVKCVKFPVINTGTAVVPCRPLLGLIEFSAGAGGRTVNAKIPDVLGRETASPLKTAFNI